MYDLTTEEAMRKLGFNGEVNASPIPMKVKLGNYGDSDGQGIGTGLIIGYSHHELLNRINYAVIAKRNGGVHLSICNQDGYSTCSVVVSDYSDVDLSSIEELVNHK